MIHNRLQQSLKRIIITRVLALADQSKIGCITQPRFAKAGTETPPQRGAALDRNGLSVSTETACRFEPKSPAGNSEICSLLKQQAAAGDIVLLFEDESEALTHPYLARAWAKRGCDLRVEAPGQARKRAMIGVLDHAAHKLIVSTSATKHSSDFIAFLDRLDAIYRPGPGRNQKPVVLVLDNGPIHTSKASRGRPGGAALVPDRMAA